MDLHVVMTIGEYAFRRVVTGWFLRLLLGSVVVALLILFMGGPDPREALVAHRDLVLEIITVAVMTLVVTMGATEIPQDISTRTLLIVLSKPVDKCEFVVGKFVGLVLVAGFATVILHLTVLLGSTYLYYTLPPPGEAMEEALAQETKPKPADKPAAAKDVKDAKDAKATAGKDEKKPAGKDKDAKDQTGAAGLQNDQLLDAVRKVEVLANPFNANTIQRAFFCFGQAVVTAGVVIFLSTQLAEIPIIFMTVFYLFVAYHIFYLNALLIVPNLNVIVRGLFSSLYYLAPNLRYLQIPPEISIIGSTNWLHFFLALLYFPLYTAVFLAMGVHAFNRRAVAG